MHRSKAFKMPITMPGTLYREMKGCGRGYCIALLACLFFLLLVHVLDGALLLVSREVYDAVIGAYKTPLMGVGELGLVGAIVYHAFNGVRIILVDFLPRGTNHQRVMFWVTILLVLALMIPLPLDIWVLCFHTRFGLKFERKMNNKIELPPPRAGKSLSA